MLRDTETYGSTRTLSVLARATRAKIGVYTMPIARIVVVTPGPRIATTASASSSTGNANITSTTRMNTVSSQPPR